MSNAILIIGLSCQENAVVKKILCNLLEIWIWLGQWTLNIQDRESSIWKIGSSLQDLTVHVLFFDTSIGIFGSVVETSQSLAGEMH